MQETRPANLQQHLCVGRGLQGLYDQQSVHRHDKANLPGELVRQLFSWCKRCLRDQGQHQADLRLREREMCRVHQQQSVHERQ